MNRLLHERALAIGQSLRLIHGDITEERVDAIVNAANAHLQHGGGVAEVISRSGGATIQAESNLWVENHGPVNHTHPAVTSGGKLPCRYVIHAVGPVWGSGQEDEKLHTTVIGVLTTADEMDLKTLSIPAISTGIFGFPKDRAADILFRAVLEYFTNHPGNRIQEIRVVVYDQPTEDAFVKEFLKL